MKRPASVCNGRAAAPLAATPLAAAPLAAAPLARATAAAPPDGGALAAAVAGRDVRGKYA